MLRRTSLPFSISQEHKHPTCNIRVTDYVGAHPLMTQIVMDLVGKAK